ncbi:MAG: glycosyltransferase [Leptolyngbyaceae bacterium]|nr:glycosyltransferase [Leptolyngbyaceae bacterium]
MAISLGVSIVSLVIWVYLLLFRGQFWRTDQHLEALDAEGNDALNPQETPECSAPPVCVVIPARNEADVLPITLRSLFTQDYDGALDVLVVDDHSTDGTATVAQQTVQDLGKADHFQLYSAQPLPPGWTGKLWALDQGTQQVMGRSPAPTYILLSDADIQHDSHNLRRLVTKAEAQSLDLASVMVRLRCESLAEHWLIPAFVFFFQKLYPFRWVNQPERKTAAAAGGCVLLRTSALQRIGGIASIREALIDDCTLAQHVKHGDPTANSALESHPIWLGLSSKTYSLRPYPNLKTIWDMVARTAYTQLNYSPLLLLGTLLGMVLVYLVAPIALIGGLLSHSPLIALIGAATWGLMAIAYSPMVRFYQCSPLYAVALPVIALLYTLMTLDSALRHWQGRGGSWKGRTYSP